MVVLPEPEAAKIALDVLRRGGNAVDAAVAAGFALAVTYPQAGNIAGGGFMLVRRADGSSFVVDYRETAPSGARRDMFLDPNRNALESLSTSSWLACGVPGTVAGLALAHERAGSVPLRRLIAPAADLAAGGFPVHARLSAALEEERDRLMPNSATAAVFFPGGKPPAPGSILVQDDLARTLRRIARDGPSAFYAGPIADGLVAAMRKHGGLITSEDLARYRAVIREPLRLAYRGCTILAPPPPSAGGILLAEMLNMIEPHDLRSLGAGSSAYLHLLAEVMKRAYADRATFLGDPEFVRIPLRGLLSPDYARRLMRGFDPEKATPSSQAGPGDPAPYDSEETTHFTIADASGNVVVNTYTLNDTFGSGAIADGLGFLLNNQMDDFSARPGTPNLYGLVGGEANAIAPGKRMLSSMTPAIVLRNGRPFLALGTRGGARITTIVLQVILNVIDFGMEIQEAVNSPRCHHQWIPDALSCESGALPADVAGNLRRRGHEIDITGPRGDVQAIQMDAAAGRLRGASDARGYGVALGD